MKKLILSLLILLFMSFTGCSSGEGTYMEIEYEGIKYCRTAGYDIPTEYNYWRAIDILDDTVEEITFPLTIEGIPIIRIDEECLKDCTSLKVITFTKTFEIIPSSAFDYCTSLENIHVLVGGEGFKSVSGVLYNYDESAIVKFPLAKNLEEYTLSDSTAVIDELAFSKCAYLKKVILPYDLMEISSNAFNDCPLLEEVQIPYDILSVKENAFVSCPSLKIKAYEINSAFKEGWNPSNYPVEIIPVS